MRLFGKRMLMLLPLMFIALTGLKGQSLSFNQSLLVTSASGQVTVPAGKVWKVVSGLSGDGTVTSTLALTHHCGGSCSGGSCGSYSCYYRKGLYAVNGIEFSYVYGCNSCGSGCNSLANCPASYTYGYSLSDFKFEGPFWMPAGATFQVFGSSIVFSVLEFNIVP